MFFVRLQQTESAEFFRRITLWKYTGCPHPGKQRHDPLQAASGSRKVLSYAEMENLNHKTVEQHQLPRRSRFYQGAIDIDFMDKKFSYKVLPESRVIFICTFDPFGQGLSRYTFHERCDEDLELCLDDGTEKVFYNCKYEGEDIPDDIRNLYEFIGTGRASDELTEKLNSAVAKARRNEVWRAQYMKEWVIIQDARDEGYEDGQKSESVRVITNMLRSGKTAEEVAELCGYTVEQVREVEESLLAIS